MQDATGNITIKAIGAAPEFPWLIIAVFVGVAIVGGYFLLKK